MVFTALGVTQRLLLTEEGRTVKVLSLEDSDKVVRPPRLRDLQESGVITLLEGSEIYDAFRAQYPVNPHISAQEELIQVDPGKTYVMTSNRKVYKGLRRNLNLNVYESGERKFGGVRYPNTLILVTDEDKENLLDRPAYFYKESLSLKPEQYLSLVNVDARRFLEQVNPQQIKSSILLQSRSVFKSDEFSRKFLRGSGDIYLIGENAVEADAKSHVDSKRLFIYSGDIPDLWYKGEMEPPQEYHFIFGLPLLVASVGFLGLFLQGYPFRWALWLITGIGAYLFFSSWHLFMVGLLVAGIVRLGLRTRSVSSGWFLLAGLVFYGFGYVPYQLVIFPRDIVVAVGGLLGLFLLTPALVDNLNKELTYADPVMAGLCSLPILIVSCVFGCQSTLFWLFISSILLPVVVMIFGMEDRYYSWVWVAGISAWLYIFSLNFAVSVLFYYVLTMVIWGIEMYIGRFNSRLGSRRYG